MKVSVFGLGYVGCVSVACLSRSGHDVIGVDIIQDKVDTIAAGKPTVVEPSVTELTEAGHIANRISATTDAQAAILDSDVSLICVGTPAKKSGAHSLTALQSTAKAIGTALLEKPAGHLVVIRSTVAPGTVENVLLPDILRPENPNRDAISVVIIPEFLREATAVRDYYDPPLVVVGTIDGQPDLHQGLIADLIATEPDQIIWVPFGVAEMMKGLCNVFHALKVAFANEVGALCEQAGVNGQQVMHLLCQDTKLNISPAYLRPGLPYGGSCLPKDLSATVALAGQLSVATPLLQSISRSNERHLQRAFDAVSPANGHRRIGMDGLAFKAGTDDLRESPLVAIAEYLIGKGCDLHIFDPAVKAAALTGANRQFIEQHIPHLAERLVASQSELVDQCDVLILTREDDSLYEQVKDLPNGPLIIDLTAKGRTVTPTPVNATV